MRVRVRSFIALISGLVAAPAQGQEPHLAERYLDVMTQVWGEQGTPDDLEELGGLLNDDATYLDERVGAQVRGSQEIISAVTQFLGTSRSPELSHVHMVQGEDGWILSFHLSMEIRGDDGWTPIERHQITVLETEDGLIKRVLDYW